MLDATIYRRATGRRALFKKTFLAMLGIVAFIGAAEGGVRMLGFVDFPLIDANNHIGYIPSPSQSGTYPNGVPWAYNSASMGTTEEFRDTGNDYLLIADSLVYGSDDYQPSEMLAPGIEKETGAKVWPIGANSWALQNEVEYMNEHPEVIDAVDGIILISNGADFGLPSSWASTYDHPRVKPTFALPYLFCRKFCRGPTPVTPPELLVEPRNGIEDLKKFAERTGKPIVM